MKSKQRLKMLHGWRRKRLGMRDMRYCRLLHSQFFFAAMLAAVLLALQATEIKAGEAVRCPATGFAELSQPLPPAVSLAESQARQPQPMIAGGGWPQRKKVKRTREDIKRERDALLERTMQEIDDIVAEFHGKLPREQAQFIGAAYGRYSSRFQDSIGDQIRAVFEAAFEERIFIPRENVFFDLAVRGLKIRRPGLDALKEALKQKRFRVFLVFNTARLFRKAYRAMQFVEEELVESGIRAIFVHSDLDTNDQDHWRFMFQIQAAVDEAQLHLYAAHIRASHEGLFMRQCVWGSLPLGFIGEEVPGEFTRRQRPRMKIVVDVLTAAWIKKIFDWYIIEGMTRQNIARQLNDDPNSPVPNKSLTGMWTAKLVRTHLMNPTYRGRWCYGAKKADWSSKKDYCRQIPRVQPLRSAQFDNLRIIDDAQWYEAQRLLANEQPTSGRRSLDGNRQTRPRLLRGLFFCPVHERQLIAGGPQGKILQCPMCRVIKVPKRPLFSLLNRQLALKLTCEKLAELVRSDEGLVSQIITACQQTAATAQRPDPEDLDRLRAQSNRLSKAIDYNRRHPGETDEEHRQAESILRDLRRELHDVSGALAAYEAATDSEIVVPRPDEVIAMLDELAGILAAAVTAETDEEMNVVRRIIDQLTGGRIDLFQIGERKIKQGWLQGRFNLDLVNVAFGRLTGVRVPVNNPTPVEITIDYRRPLLIDEHMHEAKRLWDQGLLGTTIARKMGRSEAYITKLIQRWFTEQGLPCPDGRKRRAEIADKQHTPPAYKELADNVVALVQQGWSNLAIAGELRTSDVTVGKAIAWWFSSRGLPAPTADERRRRFLLRAKGLLEAGRLLKDIAAELNYSPRGLKLALKALYAELGEAMPDGRSLRWKTGESVNG